MLSKTETLNRIADRLTNININELTGAELRICKILEEAGIVYKKDFDEAESVYKEVKKVGNLDITIGEIPPATLEMEDVTEEMWEYAQRLHSVHPKTVIQNIKAIRAKFNLGLKDSKMILDKVRGF